MFRRDIQSELEKWQEKKNRKPLVLRGARQVGKTTVVNQFAQRFDNYLYLNLENEELAHFFETYSPIDELLINLFTYCKKPRKEGKTLIFIDEIQNSKAAVAKLRYFYEEAPWIYVIAAGSLLESLLDVHISFPVGRVEYLAVRPCSFGEYMTATGEDALRTLISQDAKSSNPFHTKLLSMFNRYALIGGMPEVVNAYIESGDIVSLNDIYETLLQGYSDDVEKYARNATQQAILRLIIKSGWAECAKAITLSNFGGSSYKSREMGEAFRALEKTMLVELVYPTTHTTPPIVDEMKRSPKLLWLDVGLVNYASDIQKEVFGAKDLHDAWRGAIAEQIVAQELLTLTDKVSAKRHYWVKPKAGSSAEVDFIISNDSKLVPIEVKTGHNAHLRSLHSFVNSASDKITAVRVWAQPFSIDDLTTTEGKAFRLLNIPYYLIGNLLTILEKYRL